MHIDENVWGWLCVVGCIVSFGSFAVPIKSKAVKRAEVDPVVYQSYKTFWALVTSVVAFTYNEFSWTPWGIVSGAFWVPGGIAAILAVSTIGLGVAQGLWSGVIILVSFVWGSIVFQEKLKSWPIALVAVGMLVLGVVGMALSPQIQKNKYQEEKKKEEEQEKYEESSRLIDGETKPKYKSVNNEDQSDMQSSWTDRCFANHKKLIGFPATLFCGVWSGSMMAPLKIAAKQGVKASGINFVFSFGTGAAMVNLVLLLLYALFRVAVLKKPVPAFHFRVMMIPGMISGVLWSIGNYLTIYAVLYLGQAVAVPSIQASLIVSGLWGIFYYRELKGWQVVAWFSSAAVMMGGLALMSQMHA